MSSSRSRARYPAASRPAQLVEQEWRIEHIDAHRRQAVFRIAGNRLRLVPASLRSRRRGSRRRPRMMPNCRAASSHPHAQRGNRDVRVLLLMKRHQLAVVHLVDVIAGKDHDILRPLFFQRVDVLVDGIGRALVPLLVDPLLRRHDVDELAQLAAQIIPPAERDVAIQAHRLVLREHENAAQAAVEAIRQREIDDAIDAAKRHGRLGPIARQRPQPRSFAPGQYDRQNFLHRQRSSRCWICARS